MNAVLALPMTNGLWVEVDAEILFDIAPHLADVATFAVHPSPDEFLKWNVSNIETGMWVMKGDNRSAAIRKAADILGSKDEEDFRRAYEKAFKTFKQLNGGAA